MGRIMTNIKDFIDSHQKSSHTSFAKDLFQGMEKEEIEWNMSDGEAKNVVAALVKNRVDIPQLLSKFGEEIFDSDFREELLVQFHTQWVKEDGLYSSDIQLRQSILRQAYVSRDEVEKIKETIDNKNIPLYVVDTLLQKPLSMKYEEYDTFIDSVLHVCKNEVRKTEIATLALKNCMLLENAFELNENVVIDATGAIKENEIGFDLNQFKNKNSKLYNKLSAHSLLGSGYEECISQVSDKDLAIKQVKKILHSKVQASAEEFRKKLFPENKKLELNENNKKVLEAIFNSGRLQRACKNYVMQNLRQNNQLSDAAAIAEGLNGEQHMLKMMLLCDSQTSKHILYMMNSILGELESKHNLNPNFLKGTLLRGTYSVGLIPETMFYSIVDFFALCFAYISKYTQKSAYIVYDKVTGNNKAREEITIYGKSDIKDAIQNLKTAMQNDFQGQQISIESKLRNDIIVYIKNNNSNAVAIAVTDELNENVKKALEAANKLTGSSRRKAYYDILEMPEMNNSTDRVLPKFADLGKASAIISLIS